MNCRPGSDKIHVVSGRSDDIPQSRLRATSAPFLFNLCFHAHNLPISRPKLSRWGSAVAYSESAVLMTLDQSNTECLSAPELRERGWTESLIKRFLKDPDKLVKNPHYSSAAPMRLYLKRRIEKAEGKQMFAEAKAIAAKRSQASKVAIHKKNYSAVCVPSSIRGCNRMIKVVSTRTSRPPLFELVAGTKLQGFLGHALLREQLLQRLR